MKKLLLSASAAAIVAAFAMPAHAECDGWYLGARAGIVKHDVSGGESSLLDSDSSNLDKEKLMLSAALGYRYEHWRGEFEYVWRDYTKEESEAFGAIDTVKFKSYSFMLNAYYDLLPYNWWTPYVNAGIGLTQLKYSNYDKNSGMVNTSAGNYKPLNFTWSLGAGLSLKITNRLNADLGYRYYDMGRIRHADVDAQEVYAGVRYVF